MEETMNWLHGEPSLEDTLSDPVVHAVMRRDAVDPENLRLFLDCMRRRLAERRQRPNWRAPRYDYAL
jgi:hypothetical protein